MRVGVCGTGAVGQTIGIGHRILGTLGALSPHLTLAVGAGVVLVLEVLRGSATLITSPAWPLAQAFVSCVSLAVVWVARARLRLGLLLVLALAFHVGWVAVHLLLGVTGDYDIVSLYPSQGDTFLQGGYPSSEYPPGAVALFAVETWLGGGEARTANAFLMIPFQLACVVAIWKLQTRWTAWLAAFVAFWPLNAFYWEFRFDLVPAAALVVGLMLARRGLWYEAGLALGLGAITKWTPALSCAALLLWLLRSRRFESAGVHLVGFAIPVLLANVPLLLWKPDELIGAYTAQNARTVTAESFVYLPLSLFWDVQPGYWYFGTADVPPDANRVAIWIHLVSVIAVMVLALLARTRSSAVAIAALAPATFLFMNRIFSPQFYVVVLAAIAVAAALVVHRRAELLAVIGACAVATVANTILFQSYLGGLPVATLPDWEVISAAAFVPTIAATIWLLVRACWQTIETPFTEDPAAGATAARLNLTVARWRSAPRTGQGRQ